VSDTSDALTALERDGLVARVGAELRTTKRWQSAMMRAAFRLLGSGDDGNDLRVPVASAFVELYGDELSTDELARYVEAMLPIEERELHPPVPRVPA
jgi:hypothetical protein